MYYQHTIFKKKKKCMYDLKYYFTNFGDLCDSVVSIYMGFLEVPPIMI